MICDDHELVRKGIVSTLETLYVIKECDGRDFEKSIQGNIPDLIIFDYILRKTNGIELFRTAYKSGYRGKSLLLTNIEDRLIKDQAQAAGMDGYLSKRENLAVLINVIHRILQGEKVFLEPEFINIENIPGNPFSMLSFREKEVVEAISQCSSYEEGALRLGMSLRTFQKHRQNISKKIGKLSNVELMKLAFVWGLVSDPGLQTTYH